MTNINLSELRGHFVQYQRVAAECRREIAEIPDQWWLDSVSNLRQVAPIVADQFKQDRPACMMAVRRQFPGMDLDAIRRFCYWCIEQYP